MEQRQTRLGVEGRSAANAVRGGGRKRSRSGDGWSGATVCCVCCVDGVLQDRVEQSRVWSSKVPWQEALDVARPGDGRSRSRRPTR